MDVENQSPRPYSIDIGERLVRSARHAIELHLTTNDFDRRVVTKNLEGITGMHGVFVTIYHYPTRTLRGCIGITKPQDHVPVTLIDAAIAAASEDPRFVPVSHRELDQIVVEVNVLTKPEKMTGTQDALKKSIKIGRDGLMVEYGYKSGLLLPEVAVEQRWTAAEFLDNVCVKAGLPKHQWKQPGVTLYRFSSQIFGEKSPGGPVEEIVL